MPTSTKPVGLGN